MNYQDLWLRVRAMMPDATTWDDLRKWAEAHPKEVANYGLGAIAATLLVVGVVKYVRYRRRENIRRYRGNNVARITSQRVSQILNDAVTDTVEDLVYKNILSRRDANKFYKRIAKDNFFKDMVSKKNKLGKLTRSAAGALKYQIRKRLGLKPGEPLPSKQVTKKTVIVEDTQAA